MALVRAEASRTFFTGAVLAVVGTLASIYMVSQFLRNSVGVIAPNLAQEMGLSASEIGLLSSVFFIAFAAAQIPLGMALDRFGPRRCMLFCAGIVIAASIVFATATSLLGLIAGRVLFGLGSSCYMVAPLTLYARRYPADRFAMLAGIQLGVGGVGALIATAPLAYSAAAIGWRATFLIVGAVMLAGAVMLMLVVRHDDGDKGQSTGADRAADSFAGLVRVLRTDSLWRLFAMHLAGYSSFALVVGLWGAPYLTHVYGYDLRGRGDLLFIAAVAQVIASFIWGPLDRPLRSYKVPVLLGAGSTAALLALVAIAGTLSTPLLIVWFAVFGFSSAYMPVLIAHGRALFPRELVGRGITILNMGTMGGVFLTQALTGAVMDLFPPSDGVYPLVAYRVVFSLQAALIALAGLMYFGARDPWGSPSS